MIPIEAMHQQNAADRRSEPNVVSLAGHIDPRQAETIVQMADGHSIRLDTSLLIPSNLGAHPFVASEESVRDPGETVIIPLVEEKLEVGKRTTVIGKVRLHKSTQAYTQALDEVLAVRTFEVERIILNRPVDAAPLVRQEGNVTVYSLVEEQLVLTKQLILKEEVRVAQLDTERRDTQVVTLHKDHLAVEREIFK